MYGYFCYAAYELDRPVVSELAVADESSVDGVAHAGMEARPVGARVVQLAVDAVEARTTAARVDRVTHVAAVPVVLTRRRETRVVLRAVACVEAVVAVAVVRRRTYTAEERIIAWTGAPTRQAGRLSGYSI